MLKIHKDYSLLAHNTFGIDARTAVFVEYSSEEELRSVAGMLRDGSLPSPWLHIGGGSNLLLTRDWPGTVLHSLVTGCNTVFRDDDNVVVRAGAGMVWDEFVAICVDKGWYGAENLSAIPGETGAAAVQNIGAYGMEAKDLVLEVETLDMTSGEKRTFSARDCRYGYRSSIFKQPENKRYVVLSVLLRLGLRPHLNIEYRALSEALAGKDRISLQDVRETVRSIRSSKLPDPSETGSAGSFSQTLSCHAPGLRNFSATGRRSPITLSRPTLSSFPRAGSSSSAGGRAVLSAGQECTPGRLLSL